MLRLLLSAALLIFTLSLTNIVAQPSINYRCPQVSEIKYDQQNNPYADTTVNTFPVHWVRAHNSQGPHPHATRFNTAFLEHSYYSDQYTILCSYETARNFVHLEIKKHQLTVAQFYGGYWKIIPDTENTWYCDGNSPEQCQFSLAI